MNNRMFNSLAAFGLGAGFMYFFDPERTRKRRALARDQASHLAHASANMMKVGGQDLLNRTKGILTEVRSSLFEEHEVMDDVVKDRVRSKMGRVISHPHAIEVSSHNGHVTLRGLILNNEVESLLSMVPKIKGVKGVTNELETHSTDEDIPALQGGNPRKRERREIFQAHWTPTTRLFVGLGGATLGIYGLARKGVPRAVMSGAGMLALARSITNLETKRLIGIGANRNAITLHKTIQVQAPIQDVYQFWLNFENFPKFMTEIKEVRVAKDGIRSHWTVQGPLNAPVSWDAEITKNVPSEVLAWKSIPGTLVQNVGQIKFVAEEHGETKLEIDFSYNPPAGALGHTLAKLFGSDPKKKIETSLYEMKQLIEQGPSPRQRQALLKA
ncbi:MAG: SRPBCC family protein [Bdellovibrionia bacterium]